MNLSIINVSIFGEKEHPNEDSVKIVIPINKIRLAPYFVVKVGVKTLKLVYRR